MYDRILNQSQTSFTTNSSKTARIVRKRDSNLSSSYNRSRSKGKQDQANTSFEEYLSKQSKFFNVQNVQAIQYEFAEQKSKTGKDQKFQRLGGGSAPLTLSQTLSTIQISRNSLIERGDRYIQPKNAVQIQKIQVVNIKQTKQRKRSPTPVKSRKQLKSQQKNSEPNPTNSQIFQLQLRVQGLQQIVNIQKKQKEKIELQLQQITKQKSNLQQIIKQMEMQNKILLNEKKLSQQKIMILEKTVLQSENNLSVAQNNLNKLRQTIKQNRISQLQSQIKKHVNINQNLNGQLAKMKQQNTALVQQIKCLLKQAQKNRQNGDIQLFMKQQSMKQQYLAKQIQKIRNQHQQFRQKSQNDKQKLLQDKIKTQDMLINYLQQQVSRHLVKIYCLQNLKQKEMNEIKQKNESQLKSLRMRYSKMVNQLKKKNTSVKSPRNQTPNCKKNSPSKNQNSPSKINNSHSNYNIVCKTSLTVLSPSQTLTSSALSANILTNSNNYNKDGNNSNCNTNNYYCASNIYRPNSIGNRGLANSQISNGRNEDYCLLQLSPQ